MIRELVNKLHRSFSERMISSRRSLKAPVKIWFEPEINTERAHDAARNACILGEMVDLSLTGIAFLVPVIRLKEKYLVGQERKLNAEIDLPTGKVNLRVIGRRYEKVGMHISSEKFLVGAHILEFAASDKENYEAFLRNKGRQSRSPAPGFELGVD